MFYLDLAIEAAEVLILAELVVLQLPSAASLVAIAYLIWFIWVLARLLARWAAHGAHQVNK